LLFIGIDGVGRIETERDRLCSCMFRPVDLHNILTIIISQFDKIYLVIKVST
jgi:hypothetical protein